MGTGIVYFNCQGYLNNKDNILVLINEWKPIIIFVSETHVSDDIENSELSVNGYKIEQCVTNNRRTGGVMALMRHDVKYKVKAIECVQNYVWMLAIEMFLSGIKYLCSVMYHPPNAENAQFVEYFSNYLDQVCECGEINIIMGDFNFDLLKYSFYGEKLLKSAYLNGFSQIVKSPTRITDKSQTLIDYIITNDKHLPYKVHLTPKISDHNILSMQIGNKNKNILETFHARSWKSYNPDAFKDYLVRTSWNDGRVSDVNVLADSFINQISDILSQMSPKVKICIQQKYQDKKWITPEIKNMMNNRDILYKRCVQERNNDLWNQYKRKRNEIVSCIRFEKDKHFKEVIDGHKTNSRELWKNLKTLLPNKNSTPPDEINFEQQIVANELCIANKFNNYFVNSINSIVDNIPKLPILDETTVTIKKYGEFRQFRTLSMQDMKKFLRNLKNVGGGECGISKAVLSDACAVVGNRLLDIINTSLSKGVFPESWKVSVVIPVQKVANTKLSTEFRPINTVPVYEKLLEQVVKQQLQDFCDANSVLVKNQSGFRADHSCESVVVSICDDFLRALDGNNLVLAVFLDFKRAFETIDRVSLLKKLNSMGIGETVYKWFKSYLTNRKQKTKFKNSLSDCVSVDHGVPQGTVLGPLLFILYINDIVNVVSRCKVVLFADDTMIYIVGRDLKEMQEAINLDLSGIFDWLCKNNLCVNTMKSKFCLFGKKHKLNTIHIDDLNIYINNERLTHEKEIKYLGVIFDSNLTFHAHADYIMNKFSKKISFIYRIGKNLSLDTKHLLYNSIAAPHLEFCSTLLFNLPSVKTKRIQIIQNRAMRTILKCDRYTPVQTMLNVLNILSVKQKVLFNVCVFIFKIEKKLVPEYVCERVQVFREVHNYSTRNCNDFVLKKCNSGQMLNSIFQGGLSEYNNLPPNIKSCDSLNTFKKLLKEHVMANV